MRALGTSAIELCGFCRKQIPPQLAHPAWRKDTHRKAAAGMAKDQAPDPRAERIKARKEKKRGRVTRADIREHGFVGAVVLEIKGAELPPPPSEDCESCLRRQARTECRRAKFTHLLETTRRFHNRHNPSA